MTEIRAIRFLFKDIFKITAVSGQTVPKLEEPGLRKLSQVNSGSGIA
jgi:hypothetical protein